MSDDAFDGFACEGCGQKVAPTAPHHNFRVRSHTQIQGYKLFDDAVDLDLCDECGTVFIELLRRGRPQS